MMNRVFVGVLAVLTGLLFYCPKSYATEELPKAGFQEWEESVECEPVEIVLTDEDKDLLKRVACLEGGEVDVEGMVYVMQVVLNRRDSDEFPNTVSEVIFQKNPVQFTTASRLSKVNPTIESEEALNATILGQYENRGALYFESLPGKVWSKCHEYLFTYGGHDFYK